MSTDTTQLNPTGSWVELSLKPIHVKLSWVEMSWVGLSCVVSVDMHSALLCVRIILPFGRLARCCLGKGCLSPHIVNQSNTVSSLKWLYVVFYVFVYIVALLGTDRSGPWRPTSVLLWPFRRLSSRCRSCSKWRRHLWRREWLPCWVFENLVVFCSTYHAVLCYCNQSIYIYIYIYKLTPNIFYSVSIEYICLHVDTDGASTS